MGIVIGNTNGVLNRSKFLEEFRARLEAEAGKDVRGVRVLADAGDPQSVNFEIQWSSLKVAKAQLDRVREILAEPSLCGEREVGLKLMSSRLD
jgi:hypothetical protein